MMARSIYFVSLLWLVLHIIATAYEAIFGGLVFHYGTAFVSLLISCVFFVTAASVLNQEVVDKRMRDMKF